LGELDAVVRDALVIFGFPAAGFSRAAFNVIYREGLGWAREFIQIICELREVCAFKIMFVTERPGVDAAIDSWVDDDDGIIWQIINCVFVEEVLDGILFEFGDVIEGN